MSHHFPSLKRYFYVCLFSTLMIWLGYSVDQSIPSVQAKEKTTVTSSDLVSSQEYKELLQVLVSKEGKVNYPLLEQKHWQLKLVKFLKLLEQPIDQKASQAAKIAFWLNAYNALTIRHVLRFPKIESVATAVRDQPRYTFFKQKVECKGSSCITLSCSFSC